MNPVDMEIFLGVSLGFGFRVGHAGFVRLDTDNLTSCRVRNR